MLFYIFKYKLYIYMCGYVNTGLMEYDNFDDTLFFNTTIADDYPRRIA